MRGVGRSNEKRKPTHRIQATQNTWQTEAVQLASEELRLWSAERGGWFLPPTESEVDRLHQTRRADREAQARAELEQEVARLRAQLKGLSEAEES